MKEEYRHYKVYAEHPSGGADIELKLSINVLGNQGIELELAALIKACGYKPKRIYLSQQYDSCVWSAVK